MFQEMLAVEVEVDVKLDPKKNTKSSRWWFQMEGSHGGTFPKEMAFSPWGVFTVIPN